ncbi:hypothetical protein C1H46_031528 [Malus baccata]|uniref:Uncharacterized protein n=1 Tax=Malus baccata TaxID=106549 RepID=A0A540L9E1_MALBA|nr:hypothetical protein C1H46_031528 [Malus baccata]
MKLASINLQIQSGYLVGDSVTPLFKDKSTGHKNKITINRGIHTTIHITLNCG